MKRKVIFISCICICFLFAGCATNAKSQLSKEKAVEQSNKNVEIKTTKDFTEELTRLGYKGEIVREEGKGLFSGALTTIKIEDNDICIYEYADNQQMEQDAKTIRVDGSMIGGTMYEFISVPHYYKKGNILVTYVGVDKELIKNIEKIMGQEFAGGN